MIDYDYFQLPEELIARFKTWQADYDEHGPWEAEEFVWDGDSHWRRGDALARNLKAVLGPNIYVEHRELVELLPDGGDASCWPRLGLPDAVPESL